MHKTACLETKGHQKVTAELYMSVRPYRGAIFFEGSDTYVCKPIHHVLQRHKTQLVLKPKQEYLLLRGLEWNTNFFFVNRLVQSHLRSVVA